MFVPELYGLKAADLGHPHFQSPARTNNDYNADLDKFSLIVLDLTLDALEAKPSLFHKYHQGDNLILARDDFRRPTSSAALSEIASIAGLRKKAEWFQDLCFAGVEDLPTLEEFCSEQRPITIGAPSFGKELSSLGIRGCHRV
jgi:hypothetical protein